MLRLFVDFWGSKKLKERATIFFQTISLFKSTTTEFARRLLAEVRVLARIAGEVGRSGGETRDALSPPQRSLLPYQEGREKKQKPAQYLKTN
jgi:hypothetical protein